MTDIISLIAFVVAFVIFVRAFRKVLERALAMSRLSLELEEECVDLLRAIDTRLSRIEKKVGVQ